MLHKTARLIVVLLILGLVAWGVFAGWQYAAARRAGTAVSHALESDWPAGAAPLPGTRERLLLAAERMQAGDFTTLIAGLDTSTTVSAEQRAAAGRFFEEHAELRDRLVASVADARSVEQDGDDVTAVRTALTRAVAAAARGDRSAVSLQVELAQGALEAIVSGQAGTASAGPQAVAGLVQQIRPSFELGRDMMTESHLAVEKLLRRARRHHADEDYTRAAAAVRLAARLSALDPTGTAADSPPEWFLSLEPADPPAAPQKQAEAAVQLCRSMAAADEPSPPVRTLIRNANQELTGARSAEAFWWATVALNALGMSDAEISAATGQNPAPSSGDGTSVKQ